MRPKLDEGWFKVAYGMLPAFLCARFRLEACIVLCEVLAQVYGRAKRKVADLDMPDIGRRWGIQRTNAWRGLTELKEAKVVTQVGEDKARVTFSEAALMALLPANVRQGIANFPMLVKSYDTPEDENGTVSTVDTVSTNGDGSSVSTVDTQTVSTCDTQTVSRVDTLSAPPPHPPSRREIEIEMSSSAARPGDAPVSKGGDGPDDVSLSTNIKGHWPAVAEAKACFGDDFARVVHAKGHDIGRTLGGRFDLFAAAIREAKETPGEIKNLYAWCLRVAGGYGESPPAPKVGKPAKAGANGHRGTPEERAREQLKARAERQAARAAGGGS